MDPNFDEAYSYYNQAKDAAMPSPESLDRASARLRSRVDTQQRAADQQAGDMYAGKGMSNSGRYDAARRSNQYGAQQAYSSGLADQWDSYQKQRQAGAGILGQLGSSYGNTATQQGDYQNTREFKPIELGIANRQAATNQYSAETDRSTNLSRSLVDFLTFMGTYGNTTGAGRFNQDFDSAKKGFLKSISMGGDDWPELPYFPDRSAW